MPPRARGRLYGGPFLLAVSCVIRDILSLSQFLSQLISPDYRDMFSHEEFVMSTANRIARISTIHALILGAAVIGLISLITPTIATAASVTVIPLPVLHIK